MTEGKVREWYLNVRTGNSNRRTGNGLVCGANELDCFEFDHPGTFKDFLEAAWAIGLGELVVKIRSGYEESTPGKGYHWLFKCADVKGNTGLARRHKTPEEFNDKDLKAIEKAAANNREHKPIKILIETRGRGGFVVTAPSCGKVHETGGSYKLISGGLESIVTITAAERDALWALARTFDQMPQPPKSKPPKTQAASSKYPDSGKKPWDDYNERMSWPDLLEPAGWTNAHTSGDIIYWRRPGKDKGWSATTGYCKTGMRVFSTSTPLPTNGPLSKFDVYKFLHHGGDPKKAAKQLVNDGFGTWIDNDGTEKPNPPPEDWKRTKSDTELHDPEYGDEEASEESAEHTEKQKRCLFRNFRDKAKGKIALSAPEIVASLDAQTEGWPKRVGERLFLRSASHEPIFLESPTQLMGWLDGIASLCWAEGSSMITQARFYEHVRKFAAEQFTAIEMLPHFPLMAGTYYMHPEIVQGKGLLDQFLDFFSAWSDVDRELIKAAILTLFWGGPAGQRPAFRVEGPTDDAPEMKGRGTGKSTLAAILASLVGGAGGGARTR